MGAVNKKQSVCRIIIFILWLRFFIRENTTLLKIILQLTNIEALANLCEESIDNQTSG